MYAITGITGKVGGALARTLLAANKSVRAVVRDEGKAKEWAGRGCEIALASMEDVDALTVAFKGAEGVFILPPSEFDPLPGFPEARAVIDAVRSALGSKCTYCSTWVTVSPCMMSVTSYPSAVRRMCTAFVSPKRLCRSPRIS